MAIPEQFLEELKARSDIVDVVGSYVHLTQKGSNYWGLCPFHNEKSPSFSVSPEKQMCYCFGCHKGGGVINFIREIENLEFVDAVKLLAQRAGMQMPETGEDRDALRRKARALDANKEAARFYHDYLMKSPGASRVREYVQQRRLSHQIVTRFGLGAAPAEWDALTRFLMDKGYTKMELIDAGLAAAGKNGGVYDKFRSRLMLPVIDTNGSVPGFTSRILPGDDGPKYLNSPETVVFKKSRLVYGLNIARRTKRPNLILVEGNIDVISLHQAGFDNAVAAMGTAFTADHARILGGATHELVICYDNDAAGKKAIEGALRELRNVDVNVRVLQLPNAADAAGRVLLDEKGQPMKQDPDDFIKRFGPAAFEKYLSGSAGQNDYRLDALQGEFDLTDEDQRLAYLKRAVETVAALQSPIEREIFGNKAAAAAGISGEAFAQEVERFRRDRFRREKRRQEKKDLMPAAQLQPRDRSIRYENVRSARAEEGVIRLLVRDASLFPMTEGLSAGSFSSPFLAQVYALLRERHAGGLSLDPDSLGENLTAEQVSHLAGVLNEPESPAHSQKAMADYIDIIETEAAKRMEGVDPLLAAQEKYRQKKAYGG